MADYQNQKQNVSEHCCASNLGSGMVIAVQCYTGSPQLVSHAPLYMRCVPHLSSCLMHHCTWDTSLTSARVPCTAVHMCVSPQLVSHAPLTTVLATSGLPHTHHLSIVLEAGLYCSLQVDVSVWTHVWPAQRIIQRTQWINGWVLPCSLFSVSNSNCLSFRSYYNKKLFKIIIQIMLYQV